MIQVGTIVRVSDNSGAVLAKCINILGHSNRKYASIGDTIVVSVKSIRKAKLSQTRKAKLTSSVKGVSVNKGEVHRALVIRTKSLSKKATKGSPTFYWFEDNAVVLLNPKAEAIATRIFGPVSGKELKDVKFLSLAPQLL